MDDKNDFYIYILRCERNFLYTGIAKDFNKRYEEHLSGKGAKYTRTNKPISIEAVWKSSGRSEASKVEYYIKSKSKKIKESFIMSRIVLEDRVALDLKLNIKRVV